MMVAATLLNDNTLHVSYAPHYSTQMLSEAMAALATCTCAPHPSSLPEPASVPLLLGLHTMGANFPFNALRRLIAPLYNHVSCNEYKRFIHNCNSVASRNECLNVRETRKRESAEMPGSASV